MKIRVLPDDLTLPIEDPRLALAVEIALTTALRESEILSLRIEDLMDGAGAIRQVIKVRVKGGRIERVYLPAGLRESIVAYIMGPRWQEEKGWLFTGNGFRRSPGIPVPKMSRSTLVYLWHKAQDKAGIEPRYRFHDLRHTAITRFWRRSRDLKLTQLFARHKNVNTTAQYTHPMEDELFEAIEEMNGG